MQCSEPISIFRFYSDVPYWKLGNQEGKLYFLQGMDNSAPRTKNAFFCIVKTHRGNPNNTYLRPRRGLPNVKQVKNGVRRIEMSHSH